MPGSLEDAWQLAREGKASDELSEYSLISAEESKVESGPGVAAPASNSSGLLPPKGPSPRSVGSPSPRSARSPGRSSLSPGRRGSPRGGDPASPGRSASYVSGSALSSFLSTEPDSVFEISASFDSDGRLVASGIGSSSQLPQSAAGSLELGSGRALRIHGKRSVAPEPSARERRNVKFGDAEILQVSTEFPSTAERDAAQAEVDLGEDEVTKPLIGNPDRGFAFQKPSAFLGIIQQVSQIRINPVVAGIAVVVAAVVAACIALVRSVHFSGFSGFGSMCPLGALGGDWDQWSSCSATCFGGPSGIQFRWRSNLKGKCRTDDAAVSGLQRRNCTGSDVLCPDVPCEVGDWQLWHGCAENSACGHGTVSSRYRAIMQQPGPRGEPCPPLADSAPCTNIRPCPDLCERVMSSWEPWSGCSAMCDIGERWRLRKIDSRQDRNRFLASECEVHAREFEYCQPDVGPCPCDRVPGARACDREALRGEVPRGKVYGQLVATQRLLLVGLRAPRMRRHTLLQSPAARDALLRSLKVQPGILQEDVPALGAHAGWQLVQVNCAKESALQPERAVHDASWMVETLDKLSTFPCEVAFEHEDGNIRELRRCFQTAVAVSVLNRSIEDITTENSQPQADPHGGLTCSLRFSATCSEEDRSPNSCSGLATRLNAMRKHLPQSLLQKCLRQADFNAGGLRWASEVQLS